MKVQLLNSSEVQKHVRQLLDEHDEIHWAVAWGSNEIEWRQLTARKSKFKNVVFGIAFAQTDPDLIAELVCTKNAYIVERISGGTFHPKVYAFRTGSKASAIIGSANFTAGGLGKNFEVSTLFEGDARNLFFEDVFEVVAKAAALGTEISPTLVANYRIRAEIEAKKPGPRRDPLPVAQMARPSAVLNFMKMDWSSYVHQLASVKQEYVAKRLDMLAAARSLFMSSNGFGSLNPLERKAIAGIVGKKERRALAYSDDWRWFGSMIGFGGLRSVIGSNNKFLGRAVDSIPLQGDVVEDDYARFIDLFKKAFANTTRAGGIATATRFLAMKRPDCFLCICQPNLQAASKSIGFAPTSLSFDNYWSQVVEPIRASSWFRSPRPLKDDEARLWDSRAAMLDAIYY